MARRILVADDNALVRHALCTMLMEAGYPEVVQAETGEDAVIKARENKPDLIILDLVMPAMDGLRAARIIKRTLPDVPIIMHTLHGSKRVALEALKAGVTKVVPKSDRAMILSAVQETLPSQEKIAAPDQPETTLVIMTTPGETVAEAVAPAETETPGDLHSSAGHAPEE